MNIYYSLISHGIFPDEHKGYHKRTRYTTELLHIDKHIFNKNRMRRKNLPLDRLQKGL